MICVHTAQALLWVFWLKCKEQASYSTRWHAMCWLQADIILAINEEFGSEYDQEAPWHSLFAEDPTQVRPTHLHFAAPPGSLHTKHLLLPRTSLLHFHVLLLLQVQVAILLLWSDAC